MRYTIHMERPISIEVAELLGVPFTWVKSEYAFKFVPTPGGLTVHRRVKRYASSWEKYKKSWFYRNYSHHPHHLITFHDEATGDTQDE